jgi:hypothetical protein
MGDPSDYANSDALVEFHAKFGEKVRSNRPVDFKPEGYIIEYELPGNFTQQQNGALDSPVSGPPKKGKSILDRAERDTGILREKRYSG